jgi:hypothetical protein
MRLERETCEGMGVLREGVLGMGSSATLIPVPPESRTPAKPFKPVRGPVAKGPAKSPSLDDRVESVAPELLPTAKPVFYGIRGIVDHHVEAALTDYRRDCTWLERLLGLLALHRRPRVYLEPRFFVEACLDLEKPPGCKRISLKDYVLVRGQHPKHEAQITVVLPSGYYYAKYM